MSVRTLDINADIGESFGNWTMGNDAAVLPRITSANIACGFHASDPVTLVRTVRLAHEHGVAIGAHPGLPDLLGFGRRVMRISPEDAYAYVVYQVGALAAAARTVGATVHHVKPHGSLMSMLATEEDLAEAVADAVLHTCDEPRIYFTAPLEGAALPEAAKARGIAVVAELYPDLSYSDEGAVIVQRQKHDTDIDFAVRQVRSFLTEGTVRTVGGRDLALEAQSICVHGDGPNAVAVIDAIRAAVESEGAAIAPLAAAGEAR